MIVEKIKYRVHRKITVDELKGLYRNAVWELMESPLTSYSDEGVTYWYCFKEDTSELHEGYYTVLLLHGEIEINTAE